MPDYMADITWGQTAAFIAGVLVIGGLIIKVWKPIKRVADSFSSLMSGWNGTPEVADASGAVIKSAVPGVLAQMQGMADQLADLKKQVGVIHHEVTPNHGGSMNDAFKRIEKKLDDHIEIAIKSDERQEATAQVVADLEPKVKRLLGEDD